MEPYDRLIAILDAFIEGYHGSLRVRGIQTALLIEQATAVGVGISFSELARKTHTPLENVRRHMSRHARLGNLRLVADPNDSRVTRVLSTGTGPSTYDPLKVAEKLLPVEQPGDKRCESGAPYAELIEVIQAFIASYPGAMKIRGIKTALLVLRATLDRSGITVSEIARETNAPVETVRRHIAKYVKAGYLRYLQDPDDDRKQRIIYTQPEEEKQRALAVVKQLSRIEKLAI